MFNFGSISKENETDNTFSMNQAMMGMAQAAQAAIDEVEARYEAQLQEQADEIAKLKSELEAQKAIVAKLNKELETQKPETEVATEVATEAPKVQVTESEVAAEKAKAPGSVFIRLATQAKEMAALKDSIAKYQQEALESKQTASALYERLVEDYSH